MTELEKKVIALFEEEWESDEDYAHFKVIEDGDWEVDCDYQFRSSIVKFMDKYYQINESRSGSYHTDYYYDDPEIFEVNKVEKVVTTIVWEKA